MEDAINYSEYMDNSAYNNTNICLICEKTMNDRTSYTIPECQHTFHADCIVNWFRSCKIVCPYCND